MKKSIQIYPLIISLISLFLIFLSFQISFAQESRAVKIVYKAPSQGNQGLIGEAQLYDNSYAVVIGINKYEALPELIGAVKDAIDVSNTLEKHNFKVELLLNEKASQKAIKEILGDLMSQQVKKNDRVLVYFAGHGVSTGAGDTSMGYLMPVEGNKDKLRSTGISMRELQDWFSDYLCKHVMFIADACYSGLALSTRSTGLSKLSKDYLLQVTTKPVRIALTAGGSGEEAHEWRGHGLFTYFFLEAMKGSADTNSDGIITSDELVAYLKPNVSQTAFAQFRAQQNPLIGRAGEGEFVFVLPEEFKMVTKSLPDIQRNPSMKDIDISKYQDLVKKVDEIEKQQYLAKLEIAWTAVQRIAKSKGIENEKRLDILKSFKEDFSQNNPHYQDLEKLIQGIQKSDTLTNIAVSKVQPYDTTKNTKSNLPLIQNDNSKNKTEENDRQFILYIVKMGREWKDLKKTLENKEISSDKKIILLTSFKNNFPQNNPYIQDVDTLIQQIKKR